MQNGYPQELSQKDVVMTLNSVGFYYLKERILFKHKLYWALKDITFDVFKGETLGVTGKNGAGKTTLLKILAGVYIPDIGKITNYGYSCSLLSLQSGLLPNLSGRDNTYLGGMVLGMKKEFIDKHVEAIKEFSGLNGFFEEPVISYSAGMKARLGFSIAFYLDPDILLIDELLGVGDNEFRQKSTQKMQEKIRSDKTIILVSHDERTINQLCDRVIYIENGTIKK